MNHKKGRKQAMTRDASALFLRGDKLWEQGNLRSAFDLFMQAAEAGDVGALQNVGYFYDLGLGVKRNKNKALYWYKRAYLLGDASSAKNIGTVWRDRGKTRVALLWFRRAVKMGDDDANLEIAKFYLQHSRYPAKAIPFLRKVRRSSKVTESSVEEATHLLQKVSRGE